MVDRLCHRRRIGRALTTALLAALALGGLAGCASKKKSGRTPFVDARVLYRQAARHLANRDLRKARATLERVQYSVENRAEVEPLVRLMLADIAFYQASTVSLIDARAQYLDFVTLNGDHPRAPYAQLQAGVASLRQANNPSRDQSELRQAIEDLQEVMRRFPDSPYARAARDKVDEAEASLAEHEFLVGRFYLNRKKYEAAATRFKLALENYPRYEERDKLLLHLARARVLGGSDVEGRLYAETLLSEYPESPWSEQAQRLIAELEQGGRGD